MSHALIFIALLTASDQGAASAPGVSSAPDQAALASADQAFVAARRAGDAAFADRDDPARLDEAIARYREASAVRPGDVAALVALARAEAFRAQSSPSDAKAAWHDASRAAEVALRSAQPRFAQGTDRGEPVARVVAAVDASGAVPLYWLALATMGMAQSRGISAVLAVKDDAIAMMRRAEELDERIDFGGPPRALGAWLATIPSAAGGGAGAARVRLDRARALFPAYQLTRVKDAGVLAVLLQDRTRFDTLLGEVLAFDDARVPEIAPENRLARRMARDLVARRDRLF